MTNRETAARMGADQVGDATPFAMPEWTALLEDFAVLGGLTWTALVAQSTPSRVRADIAAAFVANQLGITARYAREGYVTDEFTTDEPAPTTAFQAIRLAGKRHIEQTAARFRSGPEPTAGEVFSDAALSRLRSTYFASALLLRTGNLYEAHAVLRMALEQIAWAFAVRDVEDFATAKRISPTKAIGQLGKVLPYVGPLYGYLSKSTHLTVESHSDFLDLSGSESKVIVRHNRRALADSWLLLLIADAWAATYERTQHRYFEFLDNWQDASGELTLREDRAFRLQSDRLRSELKRAVAEAYGD